MSEFTEVPASKKSLGQRKPIYGVATNDANYLIMAEVDGKRIRCPIYNTWRDMLRRCLDKQFQDKHPTYKNCTVHKDWLLFSNFYKWMTKQKWASKQLDKDIIKPNNKHYSPKTCAFIDGHINTLLVDGSVKKNGLQKGVRLVSSKGFKSKFSDKKYRAICSVKGKDKHIGCFSTAQEAYKAYMEYKSKILTDFANEQTDIRVKNGLLEHANLFLNRI